MILCACRIYFVVVVIIVVVMHVVSYGLRYSSSSYTVIVISEI